MAPYIFVYGSRIQVLHQHFIRFVVRSDDQLNKRYGRSAGGKDYDCLILSVYETTDHCLKPNVYDMLSAAIFLGSYILTICKGHLCFDCAIYCNLEHVFVRVVVYKA